MLRRLPVVPTLVVLLAVGIMVRLGFWQLDRMHQKEALLARYEAAAKDARSVPFPTDKDEIEQALYRRSEVVCASFGEDMPVGGENSAGISGWVHRFPCETFEGFTARLVLGWSIDPAPRHWAYGGRFRGVIAPGGRLVVVDPMLSETFGLQANARPDPRNIPNNHLSYAVQWFLFAGVALVIFVLAVRKRLKESVS